MNNIPQRISNKRKQMGEVAWAEHVRLRKNKKASDYNNKNIDRVIRWRQRNKLKLIEYKGGKCEKCGYNKLIPSAYDFHHIDPSIKEFNISRTIRNFEACKKEVDKCMLLCKNCHAEIHHEIYEQQKVDKINKTK